MTHAFPGLLIVPIFLALLLLTFRPRIVWKLLLAPVVALVAAGQILRTFLHFPANVTKWLAYSVSDHEASSLRHHAETAVILAQAGPEFEGAARELLNRVLAGYGIRPAADHEPAPTEDPFHAASRRAAAEAVGATRGKAARPPRVGDVVGTAGTQGGSST